MNSETTKPTQPSPLTRQEHNLLVQLAEGSTRTQVAKAWDISVSRVNLLMREVEKKLDARTTEHAVAIAIRSGWL